MNEVQIQVLIDRCIKYFRDNCYTENRISKYRSLWRTGVVRYMSEHDIELRVKGTGSADPLLDAITSES